MVQDSSPSKDTRTQLLNAAIDMFHEKGFQKTRVSDIVAAAQVAQGTFYLYFKSKDEIFLQIAADFKNRFAELIENSDQLLSGNSYPGDQGEPVDLYSPDGAALLRKHQDGAHPVLRERSGRLSVPPYLAGAL